MSREDLVLHSSLPLNQLIESLRRQTDEETWTAAIFPWFSGDRPVIAKFNGHSFRLRKRRNFSHNSFEALLYGNLIPDQTGTRIELRFDIHPFSKWFMRVWLGIAICFCAFAWLTLFKSLFQSETTKEDWMFPLFSSGFVLFGIVFPKGMPVPESRNRKIPS